MTLDGVCVVVQARMSSSRLPGKVLMPLAGAPLLQRLLQRLGDLPVIVATSDHSSDDPVARLCKDRGTACHRGDLDDVLGRYVAALSDDCDTVVRITADCPFIFSGLVTRILQKYQSEQPWVQYAGNTVFRTQPDGLDVEVFSAGLLKSAARRATEKSDREHVTPWIRRRARSLPVGQETDLSYLRWTLDVAEDYECIAAIYQALYHQDPDFSDVDIYQLLLDQPHLIRVSDGTPDEKARYDLCRSIERHLVRCRRGDPL